MGGQEKLELSGKKAQELDVSDKYLLLLMHEKDAVKSMRRKYVSWKYIALVLIAIIIVLLGVALYFAFGWLFAGVGSLVVFLVSCILGKYKFWKHCPQDVLEIIFQESGAELKNRYSTKT